MEQWYNLTEKERVNNVYSNYTIKDFWDWWSDGKDRYMEIRIVKNFPLLKETAERFNLSWSNSGVYVNNALDLKKVIAFVRDKKTTVWYSIQPRKKNIKRDGSFGLEGKDYFVDEIAFIFVDIDRKIKQDVASCNDLENCDKMIEVLLDRFKIEDWNKNYAKICSGNGLHLLIKLDIPIKIPDVEFEKVIQHNTNTNKKEEVFLPHFNDDFELMKKLIPSGIGRDIKKFTRKYEDTLNVEVDDMVFKLSGVGALPFTKNIKYKTFRWRGIITIEAGTNKGLSDYVMLKEQNIQLYKKKNILAKSRAILAKDRIYKNKFDEHILIRFMLDNEFPEGGINNKLWFQLKILLRDSNIDIVDKEFRIIHEQLKRKHSRTFSSNIPNDQYNFNKTTINNFCIDICHPPLYKLWENKKKTTNFGLNKISYKIKILSKKKINLEEDTTIYEDLKKCKKVLKPKEYAGNGIIIAQFINGCIDKYGEDKTKYYCKYVLKDWFGRE